MENVIGKMPSGLSILQNIYDVIRIVDPITKKIMIIKDNKIIDLNGTCHDFWSKDAFCENCVSMRAFIQKDTFVKIAYKQQSVILVTAAPINIDGEVYIIETLKDISQNSVLDTFENKEANIEEFIRELNQKNIRDEVAGVYNRMYINERLPVDINNSVLNEYPLSVIIADVTSFDSINYKYGHLFIDKVIKDFAVIISSSIPKGSNWVGRYSEERFLMVLNNTNTENANKVAVKIRKLIEETVFKYDAVHLKLNVDFRVYSVGDGESELRRMIPCAAKSQDNAKKEDPNHVAANSDIKVAEIPLPKLVREMEEIRSILNEMCLTSNDGDNNENRLKISQYLDELIVEYMKRIS